MKKQYTKKQIQEAINYWQKQLKTMNESISSQKIAQLQNQLNSGTWNLVLTSKDGAISERIATGIIPQEFQNEFQQAIGKYGNSDRIWYYCPEKNNFYCASALKNKNIQLLPVGQNAISNDKDINNIAEEWYSKLRANPQLVTVIQRNGKTIQFEATLKDVPQDKYDSMYSERQSKLWFVQPEFNEEKFINLQRYDIADISFKQVPYRVLVSDKIGRNIPKVVKTTLNLQTAIDELSRRARIDQALGREHNRSDDKLDINGVKSHYYGYGCSIWIDQTTEKPSTKY